MTHTIPTDAVRFSVDTADQFTPGRRVLVVREALGRVSPGEYTIRHAGGATGVWLDLPEHAYFNIGDEFYLLPEESTAAQPEVDVEALKLANAALSQEVARLQSRTNGEALVRDRAQEAFIEVLDDRDEDSERYTALAEFFGTMGWDVPDLMVDFEAEVTLTVTVRGRVKRGNLRDSFIQDSISVNRVELEGDSDIEDFECEDDGNIYGVDAREV